MIGKGSDNSLTGKVGRQLKGDGDAGEPRYSLRSSVTEADPKAIPNHHRRPIHRDADPLPFVCLHVLSGL